MNEIFLNHAAASSVVGSSLGLKNKFVASSIQPVIVDAYHKNQAKERCH